MDERIASLKTHMATVGHLQRVLALLEWDQQVNMPPGGAKARAEQIGIVYTVFHQKMTGEETGRLLDAAESAASGLDPESDEAAFVRVTRHEYDRATKIPTPL